MKYSLLVLSALFCIGCTHKAEPVKTGLLSITPQYIEYENSPEAFCIAANGKAASILVSPEDWEGVVRAANDLGNDVPVFDDAEKYLRRNVVRKIADDRKRRGEKFPHVCL